MADSNSLSLALLNLGVARAASLQLDADLALGHIDICVVNEPYAPEGVLLHFSSRLRILSFKDDMPKAAIIINNYDIKYFILFCSQSVVSVNILYKSFDFVITGVYCSPSGDISTELSTLEYIHRTHGHKPHIILGDFNAKSPLWGNRPLDDRGTEVIEFMERNELILLNSPNSIPTFDCSRGQSWIDLCFTSDRDFSYEFNVDDRITNSDHNIVEIKVSTEKEYLGQTKKIFRLHKWLELKISIKSIIEEVMNRELNIDNVNDVIKWTQEQVYNRCTHTISENRTINKNAYWWNDELRANRSRVRAMRRRYQKETDDTIRERLKIRYKKAYAGYKRKIIRTKRNAVKDYLNNVINTYGSHFRLISDKRKVILEFNRVRKQDGGFTESRNETIEEVLRFHFPNSGEVQIDTPGLAWDDQEITHVEIERVIAESKLRKTPGLDGIPFEVIREFYYANKNWFKNIFDICYRNGIFPNIWKEAKVILLPKKGKDSTLCNAYRPICLLPCWGKLYDKLIKNRLVYHLEEQELIHKNQFGFRKGRSTEDALRNIVTRIEENIANKDISLMISLDFQSAFNSVNINILITKILELDIPEALKKVLINFCVERKVNIEGIELSYDTGVPQGSSLGPILWNIFINDILNIDLDGALIQAFADDLVILVHDRASYRFTEKVNRLLIKINDWITTHRLTLNYDKCEFILIYKGKRIRHIPSIKINNRKVKYVRELKYLGVTFDEKLTWVKHVNVMKDKVFNFQSKLNRLTRATWGLKGNILKATYESVTEKYILYGSSIWFVDTVRVRRKAIQAQRCALIGVVKAYKTVSTETINVLSGVIPIDIKARSINILHRLYKMRKDVYIGDRSIINEELEVEYKNLTEPWKDLTVEWYYQDIDIYDFKIFTDGSKIENRVGCAFIVIDKYNQYIHREKHRLQDGNTVFQAETWALLKAVQFVRLNKLNNVGIYTDSRSALQALRQMDSKNIIIREIQEEIRKCMNKVVLHWVKAHIGIQYNEEADLLAKEATLEETIHVDLGLTRRQVKNLLNNEMMKEWQVSWDTSEKGRRTQQLIPRVSRKRCIADFYVNQVLTGHGAFPMYQARFHGKDETCFCCCEPGTVEHIIYNCQLFDTIRKDYFPCNFKNLNLYDLCKRYRIGICKILHCLLSLYFE